MADASSTGSLDELLRSLQDGQKKQQPTPVSPPAQQPAPVSAPQTPPTPTSVAQSQPAARRTQKSEAPFQRKKLDIASLPPLGGQGAPEKPKVAVVPGAPQVKEQTIPVPQGQKTTIRTMAYDIANAGSGSIAGGVAVEMPATTTPPQGVQQKEASLSPTSGVPLPPQQAQQPLPVTGHGRVSARTIVYVVVAAIALGAGAAYWIAQSPEASRLIPRESKIPETMPLPSGARPRLSTLLGGATETLPLSGELSGVTLHNAASSLVPAPGRLRRFQLTAVEGVAPLSHPRDIFEALEVVRPSEIDAMWGDEGALLAYGQPSIFNAKGVLMSPPPTQETRLVLIGEVNDVALASAAMDIWKTTGIDKSLADLLRYDVLKASTPGIQTGAYKAYVVQYKNFPRSDLSLDYAIVEDAEGKAYIIFANSKESLSATLDLFEKGLPRETQ
ncbi:MAG: hypothetical protein AAB608_02740 [Patescibacteria group bacterium]